MHPHATLIHRFYSAFQQKDYQTMAACYHPEVVFSDEVFQELKGWRAAAMWRMLCERGKDLVITFDQVAADDTKGSAHWEAWYTFSFTGRKVHNSLQARFRFQDGLIVEHRDTFDLHSWMAQALGITGTLLGWASPVQASLRNKAMASLEAFIEEKKLAPPSF